MGEQEIFLNQPLVNMFFRPKLYSGKWDPILNDYNIFL